MKLEFLDEVKRERAIVACCGKRHQANLTPRYQGNSMMYAFTERGRGLRVQRLGGTVVVSAEVGAIGAWPE